MSSSVVPLASLSVEGVSDMVKGWNLSVLIKGLKDQEIDGDCLSLAEEGDFDTADFPQVSRLKWRVFWKKLANAKKNGVSHSKPSPPSLPTTTTTTTKQRFFQLQNHSSDLI